MGFFDAAFKAAFPPPKPFAPYSFPKIQMQNYKPMQLQGSILNPPNPGQMPAVKQGSVKATPGQLQTWAKMTNFATPADFEQYVQRKVSVTTLIASMTIPFVGLLGLLAPRKVIRTDLKVSDFSPTQPGIPNPPSKPRTFDHYGDFNFRIQIEGVEAGAFQKVDGVDFELDLIEYRDSMDPHPHKRTGMHRYGNIKLTKGVIKGNTALWDWCVAIMQGKIDRRNGSIHVLDDSTKEDIVTIDFFAAWPCKWSGLRLDGKGSGTLIEELELAIDFFVKK